MTLQEEQKLETFKEFIEKGKYWFNKLNEYYTNERLLNIDDFKVITENIIQINYLHKPYVLELTHDEESNRGKIIVYESTENTHFLTEPKFKLKENSLIYFDQIGNIFLKGSKIGHFNPNNSAEDIIKEATKK